MGFYSPDTAAFLMDVSPHTIREWLNDPTTGLGSVRLVSDKNLKAVVEQEGFRGGAPRRVEARALARFVLRRRRKSNWDVSPLQEPTEQEIDNLVSQFTVQVVLYKQIKKAAKKRGEQVVSSLAESLISLNGAGGESADSVEGKGAEPR